MVKYVICLLILIIVGVAAVYVWHNPLGRSAGENASLLFSPRLA